MIRLADRTARIASSPTMKVTATVDRLRREGVEVIDFGAGEPDFGTPDFDQRRGEARDRSAFLEVHAGRRHRRAEAGDLRSLSRPTTASSTARIRSSPAPAASRRCSIPRWRSSDRGDEVIMHAPYWPTLTEQVKLAEATPVVVQTNAADGFAITAAPMSARA